MTRFRAMLGALLIIPALALTACGGSTPPPRNLPVTVTASAPSTAVTPTPEFSTPSDDSTLSATDQGFVGVIRDNVTALSDYSDADIVMLGNLVCQDFQSGDSVDTVISDVFNIPNIDGSGAGYFTGASVGAYCPEYLPDLKAWVATAAPSD